MLQTKIHKHLVAHISIYDAILQGFTLFVIAL
jgi:hypothetical protein